MGILDKLSNFSLIPRPEQEKRVSLFKAFKRPLVRTHHDALLHVSTPEDREQLEGTMSHLVEQFREEADAFVHSLEAAKDKKSFRKALNALMHFMRVTGLMKWSKRLTAAGAAGVLLTACGHNELMAKFQQLETSNKETLGKMEQVLKENSMLRGQLMELSGILTQISNKQQLSDADTKRLQASLEGFGRSWSNANLELFTKLSDIKAMLEKGQQPTPEMLDGLNGAIGNALTPPPSDFELPKGYENMPPLPEETDLPPMPPMPPMPEAPEVPSVSSKDVLLRHLNFMAPTLDGDLENTPVFEGSVKNMHPTEDMIMHDMALEFNHIPKPGERFNLVLANGVELFHDLSLDENGQPAASRNAQAEANFSVTNGGMRIDVRMLDPELFLKPGDDMGFTLQVTHPMPKPVEVPSEELSEDAELREAPEEQSLHTLNPFGSPSKITMSFRGRQSGVYMTTTR